MSDGRDLLPPDVQALVAAERNRFAIPEEARARLASKLAAGACAFGHDGHGAGPSAPPAGAASLASGSSTLLGSAAAKLIVALSVVGVATVLVRARSDSRAPAAPVVAWSPPLAAAATTVDAPLRAPPAEPAAPSSTPLRTEVVPPVAPAMQAAHASNAAVSARRREETREDSASLAEERGLLDDARASIVVGSPEAAVPVLESCAVRFPVGPLTEERLALQIRALARTGRGDEARALLAKLRTGYPHSFVLQGAVDDVARIP
jgi:hypothetical protein